MFSPKGEEVADRRSRCRGDAEESRRRGKAIDPRGYSRTGRPDPYDERRDFSGGRDPFDEARRTRANRNAEETSRRDRYAAGKDSSAETRNPPSRRLETNLQASGLYEGGYGPGEEAYNSWGRSDPYAEEDDPY